MKKNGIINSNQRAVSVQFKNTKTGLLITETFYGNEGKVSEQIDDYLQQNPDCEYKQQFNGYFGKTILGLIITGLILFFAL